MAVGCVLIVLSAVIITQADQAEPMPEAEQNVLEPDLTALQTNLEEDFLKIQTKVLETSLKMSTAVQQATKEAFKIMDESKLALGVTLSLVSQAESKALQTPDIICRRCIDKLGIKRALSYIKMRTNFKIFDCTHKLSNHVLALEKKMTIIINTAREIFMRTLNSRWLCQPDNNEFGEEWSTVMKEACMSSLKLESEEMNQKIPGKTEELLQEALNVETDYTPSIKECIRESSYAMSDKATFIIRQIKNCTHASRFGGLFDPMKYIMI